MNESPLQQLYLLGGSHERLQAHPQRCASHQHAELGSRRAHAHQPRGPGHHRCPRSRAGGQGHVPRGRVHGPLGRDQAHRRAPRPREVRAQARCRRGGEPGLAP